MSDLDPVSDLDLVTSKLLCQSLVTQTWFLENYSNFERCTTFRFRITVGVEQTEGRTDGWMWCDVYCGLLGQNRT